MPAHTDLPVLRDRSALQPRQRATTSFLLLGRRLGLTLYRSTFLGVPPWLGCDRICCIDTAVSARSHVPTWTFRHQRRPSVPTRILGIDKCESCHVCSSRLCHALVRSHLVRLNHVDDTVLMIDNVVCRAGDLTSPHSLSSKTAWFAWTSLS